MVEHRNVKISKRLVAVNSASSVLAKIVNMTVLLWVYQYLLKRIPAEEFAILPVVTSIMVFAPLFFSFFTGGVARYVVEAYAKGEFDRVAGIISSIVPPLAGMALLFVAGGGLFAANIEDILNVAPQMVDDARIMMFLLVVSFAFQMAAIPLGAGYHVRQRFVELNLLGVARDTLRMILLLVLLLGIGPHVIWVVVATFISEILYTIIMVSRSFAMLPEMKVSLARFERRQAWELVSFGMWTTLGKLGGVMYTNAATIILNLYGTAVDVTSYHIGATFFRQLDSTINLAAQPLQPVMTAMHALNDREKLGATVFRGGRYALWVAMAAAAPLTIYSDIFIDLYLGPEYSQAAFVIALFMAIFPTTKPTTLLAMTAMAMARVREFFLPAFLFQLAGLGLMLWFVMATDWGAIGVTLSLTIITVASQLFYYWPLCLKLTGRPASDFIWKVLVPGFTPALAGGGAWLALRFAVQPDSWLELFSCGALGGIVYLAVLVTVSMERWERNQILSGLRARRLL